MRGLLPVYEAFVRAIRPRRAEFWELGVRITYGNADQHHRDTLSKIWVFRWYLQRDPRGERWSTLAELWREAQLESLPGPDVRGLASGGGSRALVEVGVGRGPVGGDGSYHFGPRPGEEMTMEEYSKVMESINSFRRCANCSAAGHSAPVCGLPRRGGLPCQLCLGAHS